MQPVQCIVCGALMEVDSIIGRNYSFPDIGCSYNPEIMYCKKCGLRMLYPLLTQKEYSEIYKDIYFIDSEDGFYEKSRKDRLRVYKYKIERIKRYAKSAKTILDIGAGEGDFLSVCRNDFTVFGLEISEHGVNIAKKIYDIDIYNGLAADALVFGKKFDVVHMHHVFEHLIDPNKFLMILKQIMHNESIFIFEVPYQFGSLQDIIREIFGLSAKRKGLIAIHHPFMYTPNSMLWLLNYNGFHVLNITTAPPERKKVLYDNFIKRIFRATLYYCQKITNRGPVIEIICKIK